MRKLIEDYYAAIAWLHHDFAAGLTNNVPYMDELMHQWMKLPLTHDDIDTLDMAWGKSELTNNFAHFERAIHRVLRRTNHA
jgi:hypothetical protein